MNMKELKAALKDLDLSTKGKKAELEARLAEAQLPEEEEVVEEPKEEKKLKTKIVKGFEWEIDDDGNLLRRL